jgi:hypothetical protein
MEGRFFAAFEPRVLSLGMAGPYGVLHQPAELEGDERGSFVSAQRFKRVERAATSEIVVDDARGIPIDCG